MATNSKNSVETKREPPPNWQRGFWSLIVTQFQTAFNDNALKFLVIYIVVATNFPREPARSSRPCHRRAFRASVYFLLDDRRLLRRPIQQAQRHHRNEIPRNRESWFSSSPVSRSEACRWSAPEFFSSARKAALFGPSKYGLLPELLPEQRLSWGNGIIELGTFVASILATMAAGILAGRYAVTNRRWFHAARVHFRRPRDESRNFARAARRSAQEISLESARRSRRANQSDARRPRPRLGRPRQYLSFFLAALLQFTIVIYGHDVLHIDDAHTSYLQAAVGIGIGIGSLAAGYLSGGKIEYGLIPLGAVGMTIFGALLYSPGPSLRPAAAHASCAARIFRRFFRRASRRSDSAPPAAGTKGGVIAAANLLSFVGIFLAAGAYYFFSSVLHQTARRNFPRWRHSHARHHGLLDLPAAGFAAALRSLGGDAYALPHSRRGPRKHPRIGRRAFRLEPHVVR